jgi:hypothetical protein
MKKESTRVNEYKNKRIKEGKAYEFRVLINDEEMTNFIKNLKNKSEFLKECIKKEMKKH